ncbi:response regulator [Herbiconiux liangxiaofengii]|uniref:response regulator n=1 Tax=Herbiconiux liangxiaofengii TaxID=3342795 RepID=UPI0035B7E512
MTGEARVPGDAAWPGEGVPGGEALPSAGNGRVIRVLVVEDDPLTAEAHAAYVGRLEGFELAAVAHTGSAAIRALREAAGAGHPSIELILLDVNLPDTTGIELCRQLRSAGIETDVVAVTAVRDAAVVRSAVSLGIVQYLIKPFTFATFAEKMVAYRDYHRRLGDSVLTDQVEIDSSFAALRRSTGGALPKGLTASTLEQVREALRASAPAGLSATELAGRLTLSRVTARRYLEHLSDTGTAVRAQRYGAPGRPEVEYRTVTS